MDSVEPFRMAVVPENVMSLKVDQIIVSSTKKTILIIHLNPLYSFVLANLHNVWMILL